MGQRMRDQPKDDWFSGTGAFHLLKKSLAGRPRDAELKITHPWQTFSLLTQRTVARYAGFVPDHVVRKPKPTLATNAFRIYIAGFDAPWRLGLMLYQEPRLRLRGVEHDQDICCGGYASRRKGEAR